MRVRCPLLRLWPLSLFFLVGCAEGDFSISFPSSPVPFEELRQRVSQITGLHFKHDVSLETTEAAEIPALVEKSFWDEHTPEKLQQLGQTYARLGLLAQGTDWAKAVASLHLSQQVIHYNAERRTIVLPQGALKPHLAIWGFPWNLPADMTKQLLLTHALAHALQEQNFQLQEKIRYRNSHDRILALRALMKGGAVLVGVASLLGEARGDPDKVVDGIKALRRIPIEIDKELAHLPEVLRQQLTFQYFQGSQFVLWAYSRSGWQGVNALFSRPPRSTEQLLHPEKYYVKRDDPVQIFPWSLLRQFSGQKIIDETLGELSIQLLLERTLPKEEAARAAAGWAGDTLLAFQQGDGLVLAWVTAWDERQEALEFFRSYAKALESRHGISLEAAPARPDTLIASGQSGPSLLLQARDNFVFFLDGIPAPRSIEIAQGLWEEIETGEEPIPPELVRRRRQLFSAKK